MSLAPFIPPELVALLGMVGGLAAFVLGIAQIVCEHRTSPMLQRVLTMLLAALCMASGFDSWRSFADSEAWPVNGKAVGFCVLLAATWGYRRVKGLRSVRLAEARAMVAGDLGLPPGSPHNHKGTP